MKAYTARDIEDILSEYLEKTAAKKAIEGFLIRKGKKEDELSEGDLSELRNEAEKTLSGAVGSSMASIIFENRFVLTENERREISESIRRSTESLKLSHQELAGVNRELKYRASMEQYIATISTDFINLSPEAIDNGIISSLEAAGTFAGCDCGFVVLFSGDGAAAGKTYRWSSGYLEHEIPLFRDFSAPLFPWWMEKLHGSENIVVPRVSELPAGAEAERAFLKAQGILSLVAVPMVSRGSLIGFLGFCSVAKEKMWIEADFSLAEMLGIIFVSALERKKTEEAFRESEEKYRTLVNNVNIGVYRNTGGPQGRFVQANPAIAKMFGYDSVEEFMRVPIAGLYRDPEDRKNFVEEVKRDGFVKNRELALQKKDGTPIWCSVTAAVQYDENGDFQFMNGVIEDITERKQTEEALRESEGRYHTLIDNVNIGIYRTTPAGSYLQTNPAMAKMFGYDAVEQLMKTPVSDIYQNPDDRKQFYEELRTTGTVRDVEMAMKKKDGTPIWTSLSVTAQFDEQGAILWVDGVMEDISERKRAEEALRKAHDELEAKVQERTAELSIANEQLRQAHLESSILYKVSSVIAREIHMDRLLEEVLDTISKLELFNVDKAGIFIVEGDRMRMIANVGHDDVFLQLHKNMKVGDCLCGEVAKTGEMMISMNSTHDARHTIVVPDAAPHGHLIVPLKTKNRVEGVMDLYVPIDAAIDEAKIRLMQSIGNQLGIAIENARLYEETKALSLQDSLTGLWNHEEILGILARELDRAEREGTSVGVVMADLDHFKKINDTYGHIAGDAVLRETAARMRSLVRPYDAVGRYGGEEFMVVLPGCAGKCAVGIAERIRRKLGDKPMDTPEGMVPVTVSLGVAESLMDTKRDANFLVRAADAALYRAKEHGRNRVEVADAEIKA